MNILNIGTLSLGEDSLVYEYHPYDHKINLQD